MPASVVTPTYDLIVVGGGMGGLATACLAQNRGLRVALVEAHSKLGGCAGHFERGPYHFDVGATALMGLRPDEPIGALLNDIGMPFEATVSPRYRICLPDRTLDLGPDPREFEASAALAFPGHDRARRTFWRLQAAVGSTLFGVASRVPRLPARTFGDLAHDLKILGIGGLLAASTWVLTVDDVLRVFGLGGDIPFRTLITMLLQDTAQAGPEVVPFANAAACLQAYRSGMSRPRGGMAALAEGLGERLTAMGGTLRVGTIVDRVEPAQGGDFVVTTRRGQRLRAREVALNIPLDLAARLLGRSLAGELARREVKSRAVWSACTAYLAIDRQAISDDAPLFHQVLMDYGQGPHDGNNVLVSLAAPGDPGYGPTDVRVATMSTHTAPSDWAGLDAAGHAAQKQLATHRMLAALARALPDAPRALRHAEFATPRSWQRYTRRLDGAVGGAPVSRRNSTFFAVDADVFGRGVWVVGDSVFPGQGTMATVLSAIRVVERITGQPWRPGAGRTSQSAPVGPALEPG